MIRVWLGYVVKATFSELDLNLPRLLLRLRTHQWWIIRKWSLAALLILNHFSLLFSDWRCCFHVLCISKSIHMTSNYANFQWKAVSTHQVSTCSMFFLKLVNKISNAVLIVSLNVFVSCHIFARWRHFRCSLSQEIFSISFLWCASWLVYDTNQCSSSNNLLIVHFSIINQISENSLFSD